MAITAQDVNKLRKMTGAGMMDCKKALVESEGDFEAAIDILRKKGQKVSASRADRETSEGSVFVKTNDDKTEGVLIALNCETDFVAKNDGFQALGNEILDAAYTNNPADVAALMTLSLGELTVAEKLTDMIGKIGEKLEISSYIRMNADQVVPYIHAGSKLGVLVGLANINGTDQTQAGKDVAMQIAAMNPLALSKNEVPQDVIDRELEIGKEQVRAEGKPENMLEKIAQGKLNKFFAENTLLSQKFVKDNSVTIEKYLDGVSKGLTVAKFERIAIGG
ncbi:Translation elongation factor Ts [hydrothermal vent metagenome]|uniref:Translation elongation factor Ts n=1 Tax=hydrothermal vent metagenome TaxID=652676 RepID=A0A3B0UCZ1_9ZZZZ